MDPDCGATDCALPAALSWQREATEAERTEHNIPNGETALIPVYGCTTHRISYDLAAGVHQATCTAPPTCSCTPAYGTPDPHR